MTVYVAQDNKGSLTSYLASPDIIKDFLKLKWQQN